VTERKIDGRTKRAADMALAKKQISRASYEAVLAATLTLAEARELGRDRGPDDTGQDSSGQDGAAERPERFSEERPQAGTGAPRTCLCGCRESVRGKNSRFRPGHDARLYGKLKRNLEKDPLLRNERFTDEQKAYAKERKLI
jgi:hypothetical protein